MPHPAERRGIWEGGSFAFWFLGPVLGLAAVVLSTVALPGGGCEEGPLPISSQHLLERGAVVGVAYLASLLTWVAAWHLVVERRREDGDWVVPAPRLVAAIVLTLGAAALYGSPHLRSVYAWFGAAGCLVGIVLFVMNGVELLRGRSLRVAEDSICGYLIVSAIGVYPAVALLALHFSAHPICDFG